MKKHRAQPVAYNPNIIVVITTNMETQLFSQDEDAIAEHKFTHVDKQQLCAYN